MDVFLQLKPEALSTLHFFLLIALSTVTSMITALVGIGGGSALIAVMISFMPVQAVVPVHALVQLGSNGGRAALMRHYIQKNHLLFFLLGCLIGSFIGGNIVLNIPAHYLELILAIFILWSSWLPIKLPIESKRGFTGLGIFTSFLTMFVGATGPFLMATLKNVIKERRALSATMACIMSIQHLIKAIVFAVLGFAYQEWLGVIVLMVITGFIGTYIGKKLLDKISNTHFHVILRWVLTLVACRLIWGFIAEVN